MHRVDITPAHTELRLADLIGPERTGTIVEAAAEIRELLDGRRVLNCNATATGGGVAEMLQVLLTTVTWLGVETGWWVLDGEPEFFATTKRIHNMLHGSPGDGQGLTDHDREIFARVAGSNLADIRDELQPGDVMIAHDPQTAPLIPGWKEQGITVVWRSHIGKDEADEHTAAAWAFLEPYITHADAVIVTRPSYTPPFDLRGPVHVIAPSIDPFAPKNVELTDAQVRASLGLAGIIDGPSDGDTSFVRRNGERGQTRAHSGVVLDGRPIPADARLVLQVSRWDRLKDMPGVVQGFLDVLDQLPADTHVALAGPATEGVTDDPEGAEVLAECRAMRRALPDEVRDRVHLVSLPMDDVDENAHLVNCLQRWADVVVQKSLVEGFGLTVTEAMWKRKPMVASAVGGIQDQITDGQDGLLVADPADLAEYGEALVRLFEDPALAERLAAGAQRRVLEDSVGDRHLLRYATLLRDLLGR